MFTLLAQFAQWLARPATARPAELSRSLMESAEARAGLSPHQARELRDAACAYLSVVR